VANLITSGADFILVDMHAEATSEKQAMGYHLEGKLQALVGTHTHVPTADARVLSGGTAYVSDVGMTGGKESIIGFDKEDFMELFLDRRTTRIGVSKGKAEFNAIVIEIDVDSRRARSIERVYRDVNP
jgi:2',3'-cyclic-nucleotide 2'-phosphodiesterase